MGQGRQILATLDVAALTKFAQAASVVDAAISGTDKLTGWLVELDAASIELIKSGKQAADAGGWIQGTLRRDES